MNGILTNTSDDLHIIKCMVKFCGMLSNEDMYERTNNTFLHGVYSPIRQTDIYQIIIQIHNLNCECVMKKICKT